MTIIFWSRLLSRPGSHINSPLALYYFLKSQLTVLMRRWPLRSPFKEEIYRKNSLTSEVLIILKKNLFSLKKLIPKSIYNIPKVLPWNHAFHFLVSLILMKKSKNRFGCRSIKNLLHVKAIFVQGKRNSERKRAASPSLWYLHIWAKLLMTLEYKFFVSEAFKDWL